MIFITGLNHFAVNVRMRAGDDDGTHEHAGWSDFVCEVH